jgi:hypothetical protein
MTSHKFLVAISWWFKLRKAKDVFFLVFCIIETRASMLPFTEDRELSNAQLNFVLNTLPMTKTTTTTTIHYWFLILEALNWTGTEKLYQILQAGSSGGL